MENAVLTPFGKQIKKRLVDIDRTQAWLIEQVRGVDSSSSVAGLLEKGLIEEAGRLDLPGRPVSFRTTDHFLRVFGLSSLEDLPPIRAEAEEGKEGPA